MSFLRIKTIKGRRYLYRQTSVRRGNRVLSIMEYICAVGLSALSPAGRSGGFSGSRSTDKRAIKHQEASDRELFAKDRGAFNVKQRQDYEREQKARDGAREAREAKMSRSEWRERDEAKAAADKTTAETMEAVKEFKERMDERAGPATTAKG
jgi:hypothetical protein